MKHFGSIVLVAFVLGGCSSVMDYGALAGDDQVRRIGRIAPARHATMSATERQRLINKLLNERNHHREDALRDIEAR